MERTNICNAMEENEFFSWLELQGHSVHVIGADSFVCWVEQY